MRSRTEAPALSIGRRREAGVWLGALAVGLAAAARLATAPFFASDDGLVHLWRVWEYARAGGATPSDHPPAGRFGEIGQQLAAFVGGGLPRWAPDAAYGFGTPLFTFYNPLSYALSVPLVALGGTAADATRLLFALTLLGSALAAYALGAYWNARAPVAAGLCAALLYTLDAYRLATVYQRGALPEALGLALAPLVVLAALRAADAPDYQEPDSSVVIPAAPDVISSASVSSGASVEPSAPLPVILSAWKDLAPQTGAPGRAGHMLGGACPERSRRARLDVGGVLALTTGAAGRVALLGLATGALILAHTIAALLTLPFALALGLARVLEAAPEARRRGLVCLVAGLSLGVALGALYWLPAFAQQATVHLDRARWTGEIGGIRGGFAWPWELVQPSLFHDYVRDFDPNAAPQLRFPRLAGLSVIALLAGAIGGWRSGRLRQPTGLVVLAALVIAIALAAPPAQPLWQWFQLLAAVQLGWRFLAIVLVAAIPLAAGLPDLPPWRGRRENPQDDTGSAAPSRQSQVAGVTVALVAAVSALAPLPMQPIPWSPARERPAELAAFERKTGEFALGALREYVPRWSDTAPESLSLAPVADDVGRVDADVQLLEASAAGRRYRVAAAAPTTLSFDVFYHPGLVARVDGGVAMLRPDGEDGLAALDLPPGSHDIALAIGSTPVERWAGAISLAGGLLIAALAGARLAASRRPLGTALAPALLLGPIVLPFVQLPTPSLASAPFGPPTRLGDAARALGVLADTSLVPSAGILTLDLHLLALRRFARNESLDLWLEDASGGRVAEAIGGPGGGFRPTSRWRPNELLVARTELRLPAELPAGSYRLGVELAGARAELGVLSLPRAGAVPTPDLLDPFVRHESIYGQELVLDGYTYDKDPTRLPLRGSFWWRRAADGAALYEATLRLVDKQGRVLAADTRRLGGAGDLRPQADFVLQPDAPPAPESYRLELLVRPVGGQPLPVRTFEGSPTEALVLTWFDVRDPCNCLPASATPLDRAFAGGIRLAGWGLARDGDDLAVTLYWRADARPTRDYTVFLHLLDGDRVVGQVDDQPNAGRRPTSTWSAGDVVPDRYRLRSSTGRATALELGLYTPADGARLPLKPPTPSNAIVLDLIAGGAR